MNEQHLAVERNLEDVKGPAGKVDDDTRERFVEREAAQVVEVVEKALAELRQRYRPFTSRPYDLPTDLETNWLSLVGSAVELHPWTYEHQVQGKSITMSAPVRWAINFRALGRSPWRPVTIARLYKHPPCWLRISGPVA